MPPLIRALTPLLQVFDMPTSIRFYRDLLGFEVMATATPGEDFTWALIRRGDSTLMLNTAYDEGERPEVPSPSRIACHADTSLFFDCDDPDEVYAWLSGQGWPARAPFDAPYGMRQVYTHDPDGFELCFQRPVR